MNAYYQINSEDTTYRTVDKEAIILNLKTGDYYSLNETGAFIWELLRQRVNIGTLVDRFVEEFGIDRKIATRDINLLLKDLISENIVKKQNE